MQDNFFLNNWIDFGTFFNRKNVKKMDL